MGLQALATSRTVFSGEGMGFEGFLSFILFWGGSLVFSSATAWVWLLMCLRIQSSPTGHHSIASKKPNPLLTASKMQVREHVREHGQHGVAAACESADLPLDC